MDALQIIGDITHGVCVLLGAGLLGELGRKPLHRRQLVGVAPRRNEAPPIDRARQELAGVFRQCAAGGVELAARESAALRYLAGER